MKILNFSIPQRYEVYMPEFARTLDVNCVFKRPDQSFLEAARENPDAEILLTDSVTDITAQIMDLLPQLRLIQTEGVAYNCIDTAAARARGIDVCNNKGCNAESVAEHTVMLMLMALRWGITGHQAVLDGHQIDMKRNCIASCSPALSQCSVGLIGFGDTAQATARRLAAFGCTLYYCTAHRRTPDIEADFGITYLPLEELTARCDVISLHCAVTSDTVGMVDAAFLARMKPNAVLVNCARGSLVNNEALRSALVDGRIGCAALDTIDPEPTPADHILVDLPPHARARVIYSSHLGGASSGAFFKAHRLLWENVRRVTKGEKPVYIVNGAKS